MNRSMWLWVYIGAFLGVIDPILTYIAITNGGQELNPLMDVLVSNGLWIEFVIVKWIALGVAFGVWYYVMEEDSIERYLTPRIGGAMVTIPLVWNVIDLGVWLV